MTSFLPLDHVIILASDPQQAGAAFGEAGFTVTPFSRHSASMGTGNCCIMLEGAYIEIIGVVEATPANAGWRGLLEKGAGIRGIALKTADVEAISREIAEKTGIAPEPVRHFSRQTADGELRFSVARIDTASTPGFQCLACQHHTPELLWRPELMRHANGARRLVSVSTPGVDILQPFASTSPTGTALVKGRNELIIAASDNRHIDLREICGTEISLVPA